MKGNIGFLKEKIENSGMTVTAVADKAGIVRGTLYNRLSGRGEFTASEILGLTEALDLDKEEVNVIFFDDRLN